MNECIWSDEDTGTKKFSPVRSDEQEWYHGNKPFSSLEFSGTEGFLFMRNITMNEGEKHMGTKIMYNHKAIEKKWREKWEETR